MTENPEAVALTDTLGQPNPERAAFERWAAQRWGAEAYATSCEWDAWQAGAAAARDCRTCAHYTPHHYGEMLHCSAPLRCVEASSYKLSGGVELWEARPTEPPPF